MRRHAPTVFLILIFLAGLSLLLYPLVSSYVNEQHETKAVAAYEQNVEKLSDEDNTALLKAAEAYNEALAKEPTSFTLTDEEMKKYESLLDPTGTGIMGSVEISSIGVSLPIYHGVSDEVLEIGAGHLPGSSLPVGGSSTHCVLSGHRGLPSSRLFTDLDQVQKGDVFLLHVLNQTLAYEVDQIKIVDPDQIDSLKIADGQDYCTLVTCTPYGINTQRLLVRGHRVAYSEAMKSTTEVTADASAYDTMLVASAIAVPFLLILFLVLMCRTSGHKKRGGAKTTCK